MSQDNIFSVDDLLTMNEIMLGRGMPTQDDGIGYNKADYGACSNYYNGISNAQIADLANRLVKYSKTQLKVDKDLMKETADYYKSLIKADEDRSIGVSVNITDNGTMISFRYNKKFIELIKHLPKRRFDPESKQWIVPNNEVVKALQKLNTVGANVGNALEYAKTHPLINTPAKINVLVKTVENEVFMKFEYNQEIVDEIRKIDKSNKKWNNKEKYWTFTKEVASKLMMNISDKADFKMI